MPVLDTLDAPVRTREQVAEAVLVETARRIEARSPLPPGLTNMAKNMSITFSDDLPRRCVARVSGRSILLRPGQSPTSMVISLLHEMAHVFVGFLQRRALGHGGDWGGGDGGSDDRPPTPHTELYAMVATALGLVVVPDEDFGYTTDELTPAAAVLLGDLVAGSADLTVSSAPFVHGP